MTYAIEFLNMLETYQSKPEVWDNELAYLLLKQKGYILQHPINAFPPKDFPYFSPSSANSCPRELYMKVKGAKRDDNLKTSVQHRWTNMGTRFGDFIQEELLYIEKHFKRLTGNLPPFTVSRTSQGFPFWEGFAKCAKQITHNGHTFYLFGTLDGKLTHHSGHEVGLEIKTKQTTAAQTGDYKMKEPKLDHIKQVCCYSIMYGLDDYILLYGNLSKKSWVMSEEEYQKNPDIRIFDVHITDVHRQNVLDNFAYVLECVKTNTPPPLDLSKWSFNNFKTACAKSLTNDELEQLKEQVKKVLKSNQPEYIKSSYFEAIQNIKELREKE